MHSGTTERGDRPQRTASAERPRSSRGSPLGVSVRFSVRVCGSRVWHPVTGPVAEAAASNCGHQSAAGGREQPGGAAETNESPRRRHHGCCRSRLHMRKEATEASLAALALSATTRGVELPDRAHPGPLLPSWNAVSSRKFPSQSIRKALKPSTSNCN